MRILVTGATSGIGRGIVEKLIKKGHHVTGIGRNFDKYPLEHENYEMLPCDFRKLNEVEKLVREVSKVNWDVVILSAGIGYFGHHEELHFSKIQEMVQVNLTSILILSQAVLRKLKKTKGKIIFVSSVTANKESPMGAAYAATKAGVSHFARSLWSEVRKYGVGVSVIEPDMTKTDFYEHTFFDVAQEKDSYLEAEDVTNAILFLLEQREGVNLHKIELQPQQHKITRKG